MVGLISQAVRIEHERDPAEVILEELGGLQDDIIVGGADVMVATYKRVGKTRGGILLAGRTSDEDDYQGVSGLVLKLGPRAYQRDRTASWFLDKNGDPRPVKPGDWVLFDTKVGFPFKLGSKTIRLIDDEHIMGILPYPDIVQ